MTARFKLFQSSFDSWQTMCTEVTDFLTSIGPANVIGVSHSQENTTAVITVWYWE